jgi:hypothetical protein
MHNYSNKLNLNSNNFSYAISRGSSMKSRGLIVGLFILCHGTGYAALPKPEKEEGQSEICPACLDDENLLELSYPKKFTVHKVNGVSHTFHTQCLHSWVVTEKKFTCPMCRGELSFEQANRLHFALGFPEDILKKLSPEEREKLRKHNADKINSITKMMRAQNGDQQNKDTDSFDDIFERIFGDTFFNRRGTNALQQQIDRLEQSNRKLVQDKQKLNDENLQLKNGLEDLKNKKNDLLNQLVAQKREYAEMVQNKNIALQELRGTQSAQSLKNKEDENTALKIERDSYRLQKNIAFGIAGVLAVSTCFLSYKIFTENKNSLTFFKGQN